MNVRQKLLSGYLVVALMVAATALIAWYTDQTSARRAAALEAAQVARGIGKDIAFGLPAYHVGELESPLYYSPSALGNYLKRLHDSQHRSVVAVDYEKYIIGDAVPDNVGSKYTHDRGDEVTKTIADGKSRVFVETSPDHPEGIKQVVVPMIGSAQTVLGAVIVEYTPLYRQMMNGARDAQTILFISAAIAFVLVLLLGYLLASSVTRRISKLTAAAGVIRTGDYTHRLPAGGADEIAGLAVAFNAMAEQLDRSAREILAKEYTDSILANAGEGICGLDATGRIAFANAAAGRITGLGVAGLLQRDASVLLPAGLKPTPGTTEGRLQRPDHSTVRIEYTISEIDKAGRRLGAVIVLRDVSRQRALEFDLRHQALHDALTGLPNRKLLISRLEEAHACACSGGESLAVLYLDLDGFKRVNDSLGHDAGDLLLQAAAHRLTGALRPQDTVARLGGDEFAVLIVGAGPDDAELLAQTCVDALSRPFVLNSREGLVSVSVGVVPDASRYARFDEVLRNADMAMYAAKDQGKNRWLRFEDHMHERLRHRPELIGAAAIRPGAHLPAPVADLHQDERSP